VTDRSSSPEISVIVPVRNGAGSLPALLRSLEAQTLARDGFEVIVVDNDSSDDTAQVASAHGVRVVHETSGIRAGARNRGVAAASTRLYAFTDVDCVADPGWVEALLGAEQLAPLVAGNVRIRVSEQPNAIERFESLWRFGQEAWVKHQGWAATANLLVHADAFEALGGFDLTWHYGEDADFCLRARDADYALDYCDEAIVEHEAERKLYPMLRRFFLHGYGGNQAFYRLGAGRRAWRDPLPALIGDRALRNIGYSRESFDAREWRRMARLARLGYAARVAGSIWAELSHVR
jgi:glycosyltransferase involved in cell wall biosynthesis